jgi:hypothetical protein
MWLVGVLTVTLGVPLPTKARKQANKLKSSRVQTSQRTTTTTTPQPPRCEKVDQGCCQPHDDAVNDRLVVVRGGGGGQVIAGKANNAWLLFTKEHLFNTAVIYIPGCIEEDMIDRSHCLAFD